MATKNVYAISESGKKVLIGIFSTGKTVTFPSMSIDSRISSTITFKINGGSTISSAEFISTYSSQTVSDIETIEAFMNNDKTGVSYTSNVPITYECTGPGVGTIGPIASTRKSHFDGGQLTYIKFTFNQNTTFSSLSFSYDNSPV